MSESEGEALGVYLFNLLNAAENNIPKLRDIYMESIKALETQDDLGDIFACIERDGIVDRYDDFTSYINLIFVETAENLDAISGALLACVDAYAAQDSEAANNLAKRVDDHNGSADLEELPKPDLDSGSPYGAMDEWQEEHTYFGDVDKDKIRSNAEPIDTDG